MDFRDSTNFTKNIEKLTKTPSVYAGQYDLAKSETCYHRYCWAVTDIERWLRSVLLEELEKSDYEEARALLHLPLQDLEVRVKADMGVRLLEGVPFGYDTTSKSISCAIKRNIPEIFYTPLGEIDAYTRKAILEYRDNPVRQLFEYLCSELDKIYGLVNKLELGFGERFLSAEFLKEPEVQDELQLHKMESLLYSVDNFFGRYMGYGSAVSEISQGYLLSSKLESDFFSQGMKKYQPKPDKNEGYHLFKDMFSKIFMDMAVEKGADTLFSFDRSIKNETHEFLSADGTVVIQLIKEPSPQGWKGRLSLDPQNPIEFCCSIYLSIRAGLESVPELAEVDWKSSYVSERHQGDIAYLDYLFHFTSTSLKEEKQIKYSVHEEKTGAEFTWYNDANIDDLRHFEYHGTSYVAACIPTPESLEDIVAQSGVPYEDHSLVEDPWSYDPGDEAFPQEGEALPEGWTISHNDEGADAWDDLFEPDFSVSDDPFASSEEDDFGSLETEDSFG